MAFEADSMLERRRLRRRVALWRSLAVLALVLLVVGTFQTVFGGKATFWTGQYVARLDVTGLIIDNRELLEAVDDVAEDNSARALLVYVDSPGGTVVGGEALFAGLRKVAERKPVVAVMGTTAASAGYMVAIAADTIFARAGTITGSIGVIFQTADMTELLRKVGVEPTAIKSGPLKAVPSPLEPLTSEGKEATQKVVDEVFAMFTELVRERRSLEAGQLAEVADGRIFTGRQALARGLVDAIGGEEEARAWLDEHKQVSRKLPLVEINPPDKSSWFLSAASAVLGKNFLPERLRLDGLIAVWHPALRL